jgi:hypothetical protein
MMIQFGSATRLEELSSLQTRLLAAFGEFRKKYPSFDEALSSYTGQYGENSVKIYEPFKISDTIDPVTIVLGRTTSLLYRDSKRSLAGAIGSVTIDRGLVYVLGRRNSLDSKFIVWSSKGETEIEQYDSRVRIVPSRVHAAIFASESGEVLFADLGSSSGSILSGETEEPEPFIVLYSPASTGIRKVTMPSKYSLK